MVLRNQSMKMIVCLQNKMKMRNWGSRGNAISSTQNWWSLITAGDVIIPVSCTKAKENDVSSWVARGFGLGWWGSVLVPRWLFLGFGHNTSNDFGGIPSLRKVCNCAWKTISVAVLVTGPIPFTCWCRTIDQNPLYCGKVCSCSSELIQINIHIAGDNAIESSSTSSGNS